MSGEEINDLREKIESLNEGLEILRTALEATLLLFARISISNDRVNRLISVLKATGNFPFQIRKFYVEKVVEYANDGEMNFEDLVEALLQGCGDEARRLVSDNLIEVNYGTQCLERWGDIIGGSNENSKNPKVLEESQRYE